MKSKTHTAAPWKTLSAGLAPILPVILIAGSLINFAQGNSYGPPIDRNPSLCRTMMPGHGFAPQTSPSPYQITVSPLRVPPGGIVHVTLEQAPGKTDTFAGFLAIGRSAKFPVDVAPYGYFLDPNRETVLRKSCSDIPNNVATHTYVPGGDEDFDKTRVELDWQVPDEPGQYRISTTFVQRFTIYWVAQLSEIIEVVDVNASFSRSNVTASRM